ncbi:MAG: PH domain-containing protein, partial [Actinomycetia bacterium]|nr:PH domain-containing protein [Actinomycetes bacterium]
MSDLERTPEQPEPASSESAAASESAVHSQVPDQVPDEVAGESVGDWQRLHPISPFLRGGLMVLAFGGYFISQRLEDLVGVRWGPEGPSPEELGVSRFLWIIVAFLAVLALVVLYGWFSWRVAKFRIGTDRLEYRWGLLFKQHRQVRYDRIQSVDISRPLLARLFGLSKVVVQSAGGSDSQVELAYLGQSKALQVRDAVLSLIDGTTAPAAGPATWAGGDPATTGAAAAPVANRAGGVAGGDYADGSGAYPSALRDSLRGEVAATRGREVLRRISVPMGRFIASLLYHPITVIVLLLVPGALIGSLLFPIAALPILAPLFFGGVLPHISRFLKEANFNVDIESDRLRITHGLTEQRSNTVPIARIQAVE